MEMSRVPLRALAFARSGDKGGNANIGVIARSKGAFEFLNEYLDEFKVSRFFGALDVKEVKKYPLPNLLAINFILVGVLGSGGSASLRIDAQGKALGQAILEMPIDIPKTRWEELQ